MLFRSHGYCLESDIKLIENKKPGDLYLYRCKNNLWDIVTPIVIGGKRLGNLFLGQFLLEDEEPDLTIFREQAQKFDFNETEYLEALKKVPRWSREMVDTVLGVYTKITMYVSSFGLKNILLTQALRERDKNLEELRENRAMLSGILNTVPQSIFWKDKNSVYLGCNKNFAESVGLAEPLDIAGMTDYDFSWTNYGADGYRRDDQEVITTNRVKFHIVEQAHKPDGTMIWVDTTKVPLSDANGNVVGILGIFDDITERKLSAEKMVKTTESLKLAQEASKAGTWDWDIVENTFYWSEEFLKLFGMGADTLPGFKAWIKSIHPEDSDHASKVIQESLEEKREYLVNDYRIILPSGEIRWIRSTGHTVYENNKPMRMYGLCMDITDNKRNIRVRTI